MKIVICDHKESLDRDVSAEIKLLKNSLGEMTDVVVYEYDGDNEKLKEAISDADGVMTSYVTFTDEIISSCQKLKAISINATGYNFIDLDSANRNNVKVAVISEYCTQEVSEHAFSLALAVARNLKNTVTVSMLIKNIPLTVYRVCSGLKVQPLVLWG